MMLRKKTQKGDGNENICLVEYSRDVYENEF